MEDHLLDGVETEAVRTIVEAVMTEGYVYRDFTNLTEEDTETLYAHAFELVNQARFEEAERTFASLCFLDHYQVRFWLGLGVCRAQRGNHSQAVKAFAMAASVDVDNPIPPLRAAESLIKLKDFESAELALQGAQHWAGNSPDYAQVREQVAVLREALSRHASH